MRRDGVKPEGSAVFIPAKGDDRKLYAVRVGGQLLAVRWPLATSGNPRPIRTDVIDMATRPIAMGPLAPDPYHLDQMLAERALREKQVEQPEEATA